jgi:Flp pilus assembly pilin Flp
MRLLTQTLPRLREAKGQGLAEYTLMLMLVAVVAIVSLTNLGLMLAAQLNAVLAVFP